jgi:hypothetical protein
MDAVHQKSVRLALGTFVICETENLLCKAGLAKLDEIKKLKSTKSAIRIPTNTDHPIGPYFTNHKQTSGELEMSPRYYRPSLKLLNEKKI